MGRYRKQSKLYIIRTRPLGIRDLVFALREKKTSSSSLETFEQAGLVIDLKPEWIPSFVEMLVKTHPTNKKNFEHFLIDPPEGILPTDVIKAMKDHSDMVPTLAAIHMQNGKTQFIEKIEDYYHLLSLLSDAKEDHLIETEECES